jgi:spore coat polysaccharide biosynthesis protein SpsF
MRIAAIVTARNTSRRLPGKATIDIGGQPALCHLLERLKRVESLSEIVVATTANPNDQSIHELAAACGVKSFAGSEHDVLERLTDAARFVSADVIVYCTGDCIFLPSSIVAQALSLQLSTGADFVSNCIPRSFVGGMDVEVLKRNVLERLNSELSDPWDREHVTEHVYLRPLRYKAHYFHAPAELHYPHFQVCLDTTEDLSLLRLLHADMVKRGDPLFGAHAIAGWLTKHPTLANTNLGTRKRSYTVGIAGLGKISWNPESTAHAPDYWTHVDAIRHVPDLVIAGVADTDPTRLARFKSASPEVEAFDTLEGLVENLELDAIYICTPTDHHVAALKSVLNKSATPVVVCEKPLGNHPAELRGLVDSYRQSGRRLLVNYWPRWSDSHAALKSAVPKLGFIQAVQRIYSLGLFNSGSYAIDQMRDLFGEISAVQAVSTVPTVRRGDDGVSAIIHFKSGLTSAHLVALNGQNHVTTDTDIIGSNGRARLIENDTKLDVYSADSQEQILKLVHSARFDDLTPFLSVAQSVVGALRFDREPPGMAHDALRAVEVCDAIRRSLANGNNLVPV